MEWKAAKPVFLQGKELEMNIQGVFRTQLDLRVIEEPIYILITAASLYKLRINGVFRVYGPARAAHGYAAVDRVRIDEYIQHGENLLEIEVAGYNCPTYYTIDQPSFLMAEVVTQSGHVLCATGRDFAGAWKCQREQKVMRYSFQRAFTEIWDYRRAEIPWTVSVTENAMQYLERSAPLPEYREDKPAVLQTGIFRYCQPERMRKPSYVTKAGERIPGFPEDQLAKMPYYEWQKMDIIWQEQLASGPFRLDQGQCLLIDMGRNHTGFIKVEATAQKNSHFMLCFDEKLTDGVIKPQNVNMVNLLDYTLPAGQWEVESFEAYGLRYACLFVVEGSLELTNFAIREYAYPSGLIQPVHISDPELERIHDAAIETFRQNAVDVYMDCPTRERAGWLCDSYYTAQAEYTFTGNNMVERSFMENYRLYTPRWGIPKGMLPMCYPGDHPNGNYIPQWAMWYILELEGFLQRSPDVDPWDYHKLCYELLEYYSEYENEDGLLENLPRWNFVEWSKANDWVHDVNYPTNMLYSKVCKIIGTIYADQSLLRKSAILAETVLSKSFQGTYFLDHAVRDKNGQLHNAQDISEVCQYYAIRFLELDMEDTRYTPLKEAVQTKFLADREPVVDGVFIEPANALMGIYLRMEILYDWGCHDLLKSELKAFFGQMAEQTGTLWEHKTNAASMNHGFASFAGVIIRKLNQT